MDISPRNNEDIGGATYVSFLKDQVRRLSAVLREYQKKYPPVKEPQLGGDEIPPWMDDPSVLSPLLIEYDGNIKALRDQIDYYKKEQEMLKKKADNIVEENNRLHEELRRSIENQLDALQQVEGISGVNQEALDNMQHQLRMISKEKDSFRDLWENANRELNNAQAALREKSEEVAFRTADLGTLQDDLRKARKFAEDLQRDKHKSKIDQEQFLQTAQSQDKEMDVLKDELRQTKTELRTFKLRNEELCKHLENLQGQVQLLDKDTQKSIGLEKTSDYTIRELQKTIIELESRCSSMMKEIGKLRGEKGDLEDSISSLQKKNSDLEDREYQATLHVRDSVQLVENALLEREQALIKEQQLSQEVNRLQESISNLLKEADRKKRLEIDNLRTQNSRQTKRLMEEIHYLEMEGAEKQAQLERALREKTAVEKELEKLYNEGPSEATRAGMTVEELQKRLSRVEVSRDEAVLQADSLQSSLRRSESQTENERGYLKSQITELKKRVKTLESEVENVSNSRLQLLDEIDKQKREVIVSNQRRDESQTKASSEVSSLMQKLEIQEKDFDSRIKATENLNRQTVNELREMLTAQQRVGNKWRDESRIMSQKFESTINEQKQESSRIERKHNELLKRYISEQERSDKFEQELMTSRSSEDKLQRMAADAEARADAASTQVQTLLNRERQLLQERKELNRELDQLKLETSRSSRKQNQWNFLGSQTPEREDFRRKANGYFP